MTDYSNLADKGELNMKGNVKIPDNLYPLTAILIVVGAWETAVDLLQIPGYLLPAPSRVLLALAEDHKLLLQHVKVTAYESVVGFVVSILLAVILSVAMDNFKVLRKALYPLLIISQTIPTMALAPLLIIWFGFGVLPKIIIIVLVCFFPIAISLSDGFSQVDEDYLKLFYAAKATKIQIYRHLKIPYAMPYFFAGLKISVTYMIMAAVIGEWMGGDKGIGVYMVRAKNAFALDKVFASIFVIVAASVLIIYVIDTTGKKLVHWK